MDKYIERKAAIAVACKGCNKEFPNEPCEPSECHIQQGLFNIPAADVVKVVRCKDCKHFKPAHFKADDGTETPWDETFSFDDRSDGIYHGGKCKHERNTAYGEKDMAFRKPDDFCSYGERREGE